MGGGWALAEMPRGGAARLSNCGHLGVNAAATRLKSEQERDMGAPWRHGPCYRFDRSWSGLPGARGWRRRRLKWRERGGGIGK